MMVAECSEVGERGWVYIAAVLAHAAEQSFACCAEGSISPASVFRPGIALLTLQSPLQRIIHDSPARVELSYEAIERVRWAFGALLGSDTSLVRKTARDPCFGPSVIAEWNRRIASPVFADVLGKELGLARTGGERITRTFCGQAALESAALIG
jgi:hypothetical protein